jgi:hypothetical protein
VSAELRDYRPAAEERDLIKRLADFPAIAAEAAERRSPQAIPTYAIRVADEFHRFYHHHRVLESDELESNGAPQTQLISRLWTHGVVEAPFGAHFTECVPDYPRDEAFQREYTAGAKDADAWAAWKAKYLDCGDHAEYRKVVGL